MAKVKQRTVPEEIKLARRVSTPLIAVSTPDQAGMTRSVIESFNGNAPPIFVWDSARGLSAGNEQGGEVMLEKSIDGEMLAHPVAALKAVMDMPPRTLCLMLNAQDHLENATVRQAISNCRDVMKGNRMTLVLMVPSVSLPESLSHDVMVIDDPLPDEAQIEAIVHETVEAAKAATAIKTPKRKDVAQAVASMKGLSAFEVEQATALTLDQLSSLDSKAMFERRNAFVENVKGLSVDRFDRTFSDVQGVERVKWFCDRLFKGPEAPHLILRIDELDKKLGGSGDHDRQGATQGDELNILLETMEDENWSGVILYGHPGCTKTMLSRATGPTFGVQTLVLDIGGTRSKYVGESEANIREAMRTVKAIGGDRVYVMATCNELDSLKPELKRRFTDGVFFFDLPTPEERDALWEMYMKQYGLEAPPEFDDTGWTGAEIRNACWLAHRLDIPLAAAQKEVVPRFVAGHNQIENRQANAANTYKCSQFEGLYKRRPYDTRAGVVRSKKSRVFAPDEAT